MKKSVMAIAGATTVVALALVGVQGASALTLYENNSYSGATYSAWPSSYVGDALNDRASSATSIGSAPTYHEDSNYSGRAFAVAGNVKFLVDYSTNLHFGETWDDRISSFN